MATTTNCCGCSLVNDYGTSLAHGTGSEADPFSLEQVDPSFGRPLLRITRTTAQAATDISFTDEVFDTAGMWSVVSPTLVVVPTSGLYLVGVQVQVTSQSQEIVELMVIHNGNVAARNELSDTSAFGGPPFLNLVYQLKTTVGDTFGSRVRTTSSTVFNCMLWACYLGKAV